MPANEIFQLRPSGWEIHPAEERFKLSTIDPTPNCAYNHYVLFFRLDDEDRAKVVDVLKTGLERTLRYVILWLRGHPHEALHVTFQDSSRGSVGTSVNRC